MQSDISSLPFLSFFTNTKNLDKTNIRSHLLKHQRPQQSGFTRGKSTTDQREYRQICSAAGQPVVTCERAGWIMLASLPGLPHPSPPQPSLNPAWKGGPAWCVGRLRVPASLSFLYPGVDASVGCGLPPCVMPLFR
ncbi:hypothetical protein GWK47_037841 [Chionoecetes opilio]|uniref:Uncharacterized protein n=1 Tax=Chionoecetes opilio TaxID=41210 RepID=A0A8J4YD50_CHIOP|nr:hypothetical protein GWK47_037841 [Chionoecetes opilio]